MLQPDYGKMRLCNITVGGSERMELTSGDLLAIYRLMDVKLSSALQPIKDDIRVIKLDIVNDIKPQIPRLTERVSLETADQTTETQPFPY